MDIETQQKLAFESNIAIISAVILVACIFLYCWMVPILRQKCANGSSSQQQQNEEGIEMRHAHIEISPENDAFTIDMEQFNRDIDLGNTTYEA